MSRIGASMLAAALAAWLPSQAMAACETRSGERIVPLVELYTSEGCSDCPPADAWLSDLARTTPHDQASFLAFHVSYWDEIGWLDRFALKSNDQRHELRVRLSGKNVTFTPQVMIGSATTVDWRGRGARQPGSPARSARDIQRDLQGREAVMRLSISSVQGAEGLRVSFSAERDSSSGEAWLWLAAYEDGLETTVRAGENEGRTLRHDRVVRALQGPWRMTRASLSEDVVLPLPAGADIARVGLVLFAESSADASALQSLQLPLAHCASLRG